MKTLQSEIKRLLKDAILDTADYGGINSYYNQDNQKLLINKQRIAAQLEKPINAKKFAESAANLWAGRLAVKADGSLSYTTGQYYPLEVAECLADVLEDANKQ